MLQTLKNADRHTQSLRYQFILRILCKENKKKAVFWSLPVDTKEIVILLDPIYGLASPTLYTEINQEFITFVMHSDWQYTYTVA